MKDFWEGVAIFQSYDLSCAIVMMRDQYKVYNTQRLSKKDKETLEAEGWKREDDVWVLKKR